MRFTNLLMKNESARRGAALTGGTNASEECRWDDHVQICVIHDDDGVVSAQFQQHLPESVLHRQRHLLADGRTSGERDEAQTLVIRHGFPYVGAAAEKCANCGREIVGFQDGSDDTGNGDAG